MTVVELHPEDLFDKEIEGTLTDDERLRLDAHVRGCDPCRLERTSRSDFREEFAATRQAAQLKGMLTLAMNASVPPAAAPLAPPAPPVAPTTALSARRMRAVMLFAAALVLLVTGAAAARWSEARRIFAPRTLAPTPSDVEVTEPARTKGSLTARSHDAPVALVETASVPEPVASVVAPPVASSPAPVVEARLPVAPRRKSAAAPSLAVASATPSAAPVPVAAPAAPIENASTAFQAANDARLQGDYAGAIARYRALGDRYAGTPEATTAEAIVGKLLLDRGDADGALRHFDVYLARGAAPLREEALVGRANALQRLGREASERAAWASLLDEFPSSVHAEEARARLADLGAR